jgi:inorganic pyrophosphatase
LEIGDKVAKVGDVKAVKILGIIGLLDQDETDWKVVVIDSTDPLAEQMNGNENKLFLLFLVLKREVWK